MVHEVSTGAECRLLELLCGRSMRCEFGLHRAADCSRPRTEFDWGSSDGRDESGNTESLAWAEVGDIAAADGSIRAVDTGGFPR